MSDVALALSSVLLDCGEFLLYLISECLRTRVTPFPLEKFRSFNINMNPSIVLLSYGPSMSASRMYTKVSLTASLFSLVHFCFNSVQVFIETSAYFKGEKNCPFCFYMYLYVCVFKARRGSRRGAHT